LEEVAVDTHGQMMAGVPEGPPGSVFAGTEPVRFRRHTTMVPIGLTAHLTEPSTLDRAVDPFARQGYEAIANLTAVMGTNPPGL
jgi:hypothetical protein